MGEIIRFRPRQGARQTSALKEQSLVGAPCGADILLFMGVRYERHVEENAVQTKGHPKRGRPKKTA